MTHSTEYYERRAALLIALRTVQADILNGTYRVVDLRALEAAFAPGFARAARIKAGLAEALPLTAATCVAEGLSRAFGGVVAQLEPAA